MTPEDTGKLAVAEYDGDYRTARKIYLAEIDTLRSALQVAEQEKERLKRSFDNACVLRDEDCARLLAKVEELRQELATENTRRILEAKLLLELHDDHSRLTQENARLKDAARKLASEASGFLAHADVERTGRHGRTNSRILRDRIEQARDAVEGRAAGLPES